MSPDERTTELIHLAVDGEATERDLAELDELLAKSAEARVLRDEIENLVRQLNGMPAAEPPRLKDAILDEIGHTATAKMNVRPFRSRRRYAAVAAWAIAASIIVALGVDKLIQSRQRPVQPGQASASMTAPDVEDWPVVANVSSPAAQLVVRRSGDLFAVQPAASAAGAISLRWDAGRFDLSETSMSPDPSRDAAAVTFSRPKQPVTIILRRRPDAFGSTDVQLSVGSQPAGHATISLD